MIPKVEPGQDHAQGLILELKSVSKAYGEEPARTRVLKNVSLTVEEGEFVAIVGFSGVGKTTLINLMAGLIAPDSGAVLFKGAPVKEPGPERGVVFQNYSLMPWLSVRGNVALAVDAVFTREVGGAAARARASARSPWSASRTRPSASRRSCPAACASAWRWRARSPWSRKCCCSTSRCRRSMR